MTNRRTTLTEYQPAPKWLTDHVQALANLCQHKRPLRVVVAPKTFFASIPGAVEGALLQLDDGEDVMILPDYAVDTSYWHDVIAHEFAHALHSGIDRLAAGKVDADGYVAEVEHLARLVGGLIQYVILHTRFRRDGTHMMVWSKDEVTP